MINTRKENKISNFLKVTFILTFVFMFARIAHASDLSGTLNTDGMLSTGLTAVVEAPAPSPVQPSSGGGNGSGGTSGSRISVPVVDNTVKNLVSPSNISTLLFPRQLKLGSVGLDVKNLQIFLNTHGYIITKSGAGSSGKETNTFGALTKVSLTKFQKQYNLIQTGILDSSTIKQISTITSTSNTNTVINTTYPSSTSFRKDLTKGDISADVKALQIFLNSRGYSVSLIGAGSPGKETTTFGEATKKALIKFQMANNISATGNLGPKTRMFISLSL